MVRSDAIPDTRRIYNFAWYVSQTEPGVISLSEEKEEKVLVYIWYDEVGRRHVHAPYMGPPPSEYDHTEW